MKNVNIFISVILEGIKNNYFFTMERGNYMELIYMYVHKYGELFVDEEFNFSQNYHVTLKNNKLILKEKKKKFGDYYGNNVSNATMFYGKNGTGKTTLLDMLGLSRNDRLDDTYSRNLGDNRTYDYTYFIMYHLKDNYFAFEFINDYFLKGTNKIINLDLGDEPYEGIFYKNAMGTLFSLDKDQFNYCKNILPQSLARYKIKGENTYAYITPGHYDTRLRTDQLNEDTFMFSRHYYFNLKHSAYLYKYLIHVMKYEYGDFLETKLTIKCKMTTSINKITDENEKNKIRKYKKELEQSLKIEENIDSKEYFLSAFYKKMIMFYLFDQLYSWLGNDGSQANKDEFDHIFNNLISRIKDNDLKKNDFLKDMIVYILECIEEIAKKNYIKVWDKELFNEIINNLEVIPSKYFKDGAIVIDLKEDVNDHVLKLLSCYDKYYDYEQRELKYNCIDKIMTLTFPRLSEGYEAFLDILAKSCDAYDHTSKDDNLILILDEPDRALHPELARNFLSELLQALNSYKDKGKVQIVMSSHSPFIVTDILPENVYLLKEQKNHTTKTKIVENIITANIYYLLLNSFMMENVIGAYSNKILEDIGKELMKSKIIEKERLEVIENIIDSVNEDVIKIRLLDEYNGYCFEHDIHKTDKDLLIDGIKNLDDGNKIEQLIKVLEEKC